MSSGAIISEGKVHVLIREDVDRETEEGAEREKGEGVERETGEGVESVTSVCFLVYIVLFCP